MRPLQLMQNAPSRSFIKLRVGLALSAIFAQSLLAAKLTATLERDTVTVGKSGEQLAFMKLVVPKKEVFVGEVLAVELQVYMRDGVVNGENILQRFDEFGGSPLKVEGFSVLKTAHAQRRRARVGNGLYNVATLVTSLSPIKTGPLTISSIDANLVLQLPSPG